MRYRIRSLLAGALLLLNRAPAVAQLCPADQLCLCAGDCDGDGEAGIVELQGCVNGFLGDAACAACDANLDGEVGIVDLQGAVNSFLDSSVCPLITLARIEVGSVAGTKGSQVALPINLASNVDDVVTLAPLRFNFDSSKLDFVDCTSAVNGKTAVAASPSAGSLSVVLYADPFAQPPQALTPISAGTIVNCHFGIKAAAAPGSSPVTFVSAGLADSMPRDFMAAGSNGGVTIQ